jgi:hypothetical protein
MAKTNNGFHKFASNMREFNTENETILVSYNTAVAAFILGEGWVKTDRKWSQTTSRHITKWLAHYAKGGALEGREVKTVPQDRLDGMLAWGIHCTENV